MDEDLPHQTCESEGSRVGETDGRPLLTTCIQTVSCAVADYAVMSKATGRLMRNDPCGTGIKLIASIFDKPDRRHSMTTFLPAPCDEVWVWEFKDEVVAALIARPLQLSSGDWCVALGGICTAVAYRKSGFASSLVESVCHYYGGQGAVLAILWASQELLGFYQHLGFIPGFRDQYCELGATTSDLSCVEALSFGKLESYEHLGFEKMRLHLHAISRGQSHMSLIVRRLYRGRWHGISRGFPWCPELGILFGGSENAPQFYSVIGYGESSITVLEFVGEPGYFSKTWTWINSAFAETPVKYNVTAPGLECYLETVDVDDCKPGLFTLYKPLGSVELPPPHTTWLERL